MDSVSLDLWLFKRRWESVYLGKHSKYFNHNSLKKNNNKAISHNQKRKKEKKKERLLIISTDSGSRLLDFEAWPHPLLMWATQLTSICFGFLIYKMEIIISSPQDYGEDYMSKEARTVSSIWLTAFVSCHHHRFLLHQSYYE